MNNDLIEKLIRLANNNPNENEANLAARKVCKMLTDYKFNGQPATIPKPTSQQQNRPWTHTPSQSQEDWFRNFWVNETQRMDRERERQKEYHRRYQEEQSRREQEPYKSVNYDFYGNPVKKPPKEKRPLKCTGCGQMIITAFIGVEATFQCNKCIWENYNRGQK